ncbi:hypothetical protein [Nocardiopsis sp. Huas11]|uniref:hypothetical protein n=1 Tax=Nocardiopsis sp. Huas11 TaxID=2183912 RepID=UPI0011C3CD02|nr:hypothetical protein [Nocardiopsis sp. Huas11]
MRTLRTILLWLGLLSLVVSVVLALALVEANAISGGVSWRCEVQSPESQECTVTTGSSILADLDLWGVTLPVVSALVGIGFLLGAIALGQTTAAPSPIVAAPPPPAPYPGPQQQRAPQPPPGHHPQHRG